MNSDNSFTRKTQRLLNGQGNRRCHCKRGRDTCPPLLACPHSEPASSRPFCKFRSRKRKTQKTVETCRRKSVLEYIRTKGTSVCPTILAERSALFPTHPTRSASRSASWRSFVGGLTPEPHRNCEAAAQAGCTTRQDSSSCRRCFGVIAVAAQSSRRGQANVQTRVRFYLTTTSDSLEVVRADRAGELAGRSSTQVVQASWEDEVLPAGCLLRDSAAVRSVSLLGLAPLPQRRCHPHKEVGFVALAGRTPCKYLILVVPKRVPLSRLRADIFHHSGSVSALLERPPPKHDLHIRLLSPVTGSAVERPHHASRDSSLSVPHRDTNSRSRSYFMVHHSLDPLLLFPSLPEKDTHSVLVPELPFRVEAVDNVPHSSAKVTEAVSIHT